MLSPLMPENITLTLALDPLLAPVLADAGQFVQVLVNLALNARDAMPVGGHLVVETVNVVLPPGARAPGSVALPPGHYVRLVVRDTGTGMDAPTLHHAFDPFFTTKAPGLGTGLGLATVYGIVKQSSGEVWVESTPGAGTTFTI